MPRQKNLRKSRSPSEQIPQTFVTKLVRNSKVEKVFAKNRPRKEASFSFAQGSTTRNFERANSHDEMRVETLSSYNMHLETYENEEKRHFPFPSNEKRSIPSFGVSSPR